MHTLKLTMEKGECWWGGDVALGGLMPLMRRSFQSFDLQRILTENQVTTLFISNKGRFVWCEDGFQVRFIFGNIVFRSEKSPIVFKEGFGNLRGAFLHASKEFFPPCGRHPAEKMFTRPQYSTWVALGYKTSQQSVLEYAEGILKAGMPAGTLIIDDGWQQSFGDWRFHSEKFPDPQELLMRLSRMGFEVMLWISPFVSRKAPDYEYLARNSMLLRNNRGEVSKTKRQKGSEAVLDFSNPDTEVWFRSKIEALEKAYPNIVGIKQDAGDPKYYFEDDISYGGVTPNEQARLWAAFAEGFAYNELRASVNFGGRAVMQRQMDKIHTWGNLAGLRSLIPCAMLQGVMGYPYLSADMVGGGQIRSFGKILKHFVNPELFIRSAEVSALMPAMQFSYPVWQLRRKKAREKILNAVKIHMEFAPYLMECVRRASETGEPIIRIMDYDFPDDGMEDITDQFMLGHKYLVAPVTRGKSTKKIVSLPTGSWKHLNTEQIYRGGQDIEVNAPTGVIPIFERLS